MTTRKHLPLSDRFELDGIVYEYDVIDRRRGRMHFSSNGEGLKEIDFEDTPAAFQRYVANTAAEYAAVEIIEKYLGKRISARRWQDYLTAWRYLHTGDSAFFKYCLGIVFDYHALDVELAQTLLLGMTRARYSSTSALVHFDCTGASGAGKNDLVNRIVALVPEIYLDLYSSVSPTALQYETLIIEEDGKRRTRKRTDKERYKGKIIVITEVADAAGFTALKALAETEEGAEFTHMATVNGGAVRMTIVGPRCVITTSVEGVNDAQIKRRFIHTSVSDDSKDNVLDKLAIAQEIVFEEKDIRDDLRTAVARAGIDLVFTTGGVTFETMNTETRRLLERLNVLFSQAGYSITNIKQFFTLCQCSALWKRFQRGYTRIEVEDVCESWFLLATFERETITKTSKSGVATLRAIKELCDEYDAEYETRKIKYEGEKAARPTRTDIAKASIVGQVTVYRLLRTKENAAGALGELLELGYVTSNYCNNQTVFELTERGELVLKPVPDAVSIGDKDYKPIEPNEVGEPGALEPVSLEHVLRAYYPEGDETKAFK
ncbi:MAG: hypothetical protein ACXVIX_10990 [Halobacteriota archaeon]